MTERVTEPTSANNDIKIERNNLRNILSSMIFDEQFDVLSNLPLFLRHQQLDRILCLSELYKKIINIPGVIVEFGIRFGQNMALFESLRSIFEPHNISRKIIGFDTFKGFPSVNSKDGNREIIREGAFNVINDYKSNLETILQYHEKEAGLYSHIKKFELIEGDATKTIQSWLNNNKEKLISLAYFDFDLYEPTKNCLEKITDRLTKGSIIAFDEINHEQFPGETIALQEVFGINNIELKRFPNNPFLAYFIYNG